MMTDTIINAVAVNVVVVTVVCVDTVVVAGFVTKMPVRMTSS